MQEPTGDQLPNRRRSVLVGCGIAGLVIVGGLLIWLGPVLKAFWSEGFFDKPPMRAYQGDSKANLRAIYQAMQLYYDSEGQYPYAEGWMDAAWSRLRTADMTEEEAKKKLRRPGLTDGFGYGFNAAFGAKIKSDVADPAKTPLVFESQSTDWNHSGDPKADGLPNGASISAEGTLLGTK